MTIAKRPLFGRDETRIAADLRQKESAIFFQGGIGFEIASVTPTSARRIADAYAAWGQGTHPAALNIGDCFAYEVARERAAPLLYVGDDFCRTDLKSAL